MAKLLEKIFPVSPTARTRKYISDAIRREAAAAGVSEVLVACIIRQESEGNIWAERGEDKYYRENLAHITDRSQLKGYVPKTNPPTLHTERSARARSYGLMQLLGATARDEGFAGKFLTELCDVDTNLKVGCGYLAKCMKRAADRAAAGRLREGRSIREQALIYYNGSPDYPPLVLRHETSGAYKEILIDV